MDELGGGISIHPPLAGRDDVVYDVCILKPISIHPPLAGRDRCHAELQDAECISIHPPLAGRDYFCDRHSRLSLRFQSTRPLRGGTLDVALGLRHSDISIHPPLAGRDEFFDDLQVDVHISIHPPLAGRDAWKPWGFGNSGYFNPPAPCGAGRSRVYPTLPTQNFNPPAPCGAGPADINAMSAPPIFQSTRPLRGGTVWLYLGCCG